jgi:hypothetical protein
VTISGAPTGLDKARVAGGVSSSSTDSFTGNTLNFRTSNLTLDTLENFEYLNFYGPAGLKAGDTMLIVAKAYTTDPASGTANLIDNVTGRSSVVAFDVDGFATPLQAGDTVMLIDARPANAAGGSGLITNSKLNRTAEGLHGVTLKYNFDIDVQNHQLLARVTGVEVNKQAKALSEGYLAGLALVNRGADVAVGHGLSRRGNGVFAVIDGDSSRHNTGSHIDADSFSLLAGISGGTPVSAAGTLTLTGFVGYGRGGYGTYNSFANAASVTGGGDSEYVGAGVLARLDIAGADEGHPYAEAHFQGGIVKTDFSSGNLTNGTGQGASYDSSSRYYSAHIGAGYIRNFAGDKELDLYAKYFFARCGGDSVRLNTGDDVSFDAVNSSRLRVGGRYVWKAGNVRYYAGLAWEFEFDGEANATVYGFMPLDAPDMVGGTGILELGLSFTPSETRPLVIDLGVKGYAGKREGISGNIRFEYML